MQTFLPFRDFERTAAVLDYRRLGKQRSECLQILNAIFDPEYGWQHHTAVRMWRGYEYTLVHYGLVICRNWINRGYRDSTKAKILSYARLCKCCDIPKWLTKEFCLAHQSNLIRKNPAYYRPIFGPHIPDNLPYIWPR